MGGVRFFNQTGSTNDIALAWAAEGAHDLALVCADEQTAGRGRGDRRWYTPSGVALAFSLILRPMPGEQQSIPCFSALGALAVCEALSARGLHPEIKWPNDVLINRRKICGVLSEAVWTGEKVESVVLGIGLNVSAQAVPQTEQLNFPATSLEAETKRITDRFLLLREILQALLYWRGLLTKDVFFHAWGSRLAFLGEQVEILGEGQVIEAGKLEGLEKDGSLRLRTAQGKTVTVGKFTCVRLCDILFVVR